MMEVQRLWEEEITSVKVSEKAFDQYSYNVNRNCLESGLLRKRKLIRNFVSSDKVVVENDYIIKKSFGNLIMTLDKKTNTINDVFNIIGKGKSVIDMVINEEKKEFATKVLKIEELKESEGLNIEGSELVRLSPKVFHRYKKLQDRNAKYIDVRRKFENIINNGKIVDIKGYINTIITEDGSVIILDTESSTVLYYKCGKDSIWDLV